MYDTYATLSNDKKSSIAQHKIHFPKTSKRLPQVLLELAVGATSHCIYFYQPNFFLFNKALVIGVRKCGTRALLEMLYLHPRIQKAAGEVHFFDRDDNYWKGLEWYRKKMPHSFRGQITIEKSPSYFVTPEVSRYFQNYVIGGKLYAYYYLMDLGTRTG